MNSTGWNGTGSFRDFYEEISYDQFHPEATVDGWYMAENNHDYYGYNQGFTYAVELVRKAVDEAEAAGMDFSQFDNDGDGWVDALNIVHAGPGAEEGDQSNIWSHKWSLSAADLAVQYDGVWIDSYTINPEIQYNTQVYIGVIAHEFGHALGLPDLYDTDGSSAGIGNWGLMSGGSWGTDGGSPWYPAHMCPWGKTQMGWVTPVLLENDTTAIELLPVETYPVVYQINHPTDDSEYFMLENRQKRGFDVNMFREGLLIWHMDDEKLTGWGPNSDEPHYGVGLEQADGQYHLELGYGRGDAGDPFPGSTGNHTFDDDSVPNSHSYYFVPSLISVNNITLIDTMVYVDVDVGTDVIVNSQLAYGSGPAWDTGTIAVALANDFDIGQFSCILHDSPDRLIITGVNLTARSAGMDVFYEESEDGNAHVELTGGIISAGTGAIFEIEYFCYSGAGMAVQIQTADADAFNAFGEEVIVTTGDGIFQIQSVPQLLSPGEASGAAGEVVALPFEFASSVPLGFIGFRFSDGPDFLSLYAEPYSDDNGNGQWDEGESFEDTNGDGAWTGEVTLGERINGWEYDVYEANNSVLFTTVNWPNPLDPDTSLMVEFNMLISPDAEAGEVALTISNILMIDFLGNPDVEGVGTDGVFTVTTGGSVGDNNNLMTAFALHQNYPNPFNPTTTIRFEVETHRQATLHIYDITGRVVKTLVDEQLQPGEYEVMWDATNVASGVYFYRLHAGDRQITRKLVLLK
jgi:M6 family metalloprotease-like protein